MNHTSQIIPSSMRLDASRPLNKPFVAQYNEKRNEIIRYFRTCPKMIREVTKLVKGKSYRAIVSPKIAEKLADGSAQFGKRGSQLSANIHDGSGKIISQVTLEEASYGVLSIGAQLALQFTLAEILEVLENIDRKVTDILQGQRDDRLAKIDTGINLYLQATESNDVNWRNQQLGLAVASLNEGRDALLRQISTDFEAVKVPGGLWSVLCNYVPFYSKKLDYQEDKIKAIQEAWLAVLKSSYVLGMVYAIRNEEKPLRASLIPLRDFIQKHGKRGSAISRQLPYDPGNAPEEIWHRSMALADVIERKDTLLTSRNSERVEIEFKPEEIWEVKKNGQ